MVEKKNKDATPEARFLDFCSLSHDEMRRLSKSTAEERLKSTWPVSAVKKDHVLTIQPMTFVEEFLCALFLAFGVPNGAFTIPLSTFLVGKFVLHDVALAFKALGVILLPLVILPQNFVPSTLQSWMAHKVVKYFSYRFIFEDVPPPMDDNQANPRILVAPPHGVFPYGNILAMIVYPCLSGYHFHGLAANSALRPPIFKQLLKSIGVIDASRTTARRALEHFPRTIGISTGGVAEVFETNADDECILLKERVGLIKLAIRTGADIVPCYLFGNTKLLSCWAGEGIPFGRSILEKISRRLTGFALVLIHGRFGLPVPFRIPVLGVMGKPIKTVHIKCEEPTKEQIDSIQKILLENMQEIFEKYKGLYGWEDKTLVIK